MLTATLAPEQHDKETAQAVLSEFPMPPELDGVTIDLRDDSFGDPAIYLSFRLKRGVPLKKKTVSRISRYMAIVSDTILRRGSSRFPYGTLDEAA